MKPPEGIDSDSNEPRDLLRHGINPYPHLTMDESRRLVYLMRKAVGMDEAEGDNHA